MSNDFFRLEFLGEYPPPQVSPFPWSVVRRLDHSRPGRPGVEWVVRDANNRFVATFDRPQDAHAIVDGTNLKAERDLIAARLAEAVGLLRRAHAVIEPQTYRDSTECSEAIHAFLATIDAESAGGAR